MLILYVECKYLLVCDLSLYFVYVIFWYREFKFFQSFTLWVCFLVFFRIHSLGFPRWLSSTEFSCNAGDSGSIPGLGRSPGGGHGNTLQYSCLENSMDWGAWQAIAHRVAKSQKWLKQLSTYTGFSHYHVVIKIFSHIFFWSKSQLCYFSSVQLLSCVRFFATPWIAALQASLSITISQSLFKLTSFESVMPANNFVLCRLLLLLPSANFQCLSSSFYE